MLQGSIFEALRNTSLDEVKSRFSSILLWCLSSNLICFILHAFINSTNLAGTEFSHSLFPLNLMSVTTLHQVTS